QRLADDRIDDLLVLDHAGEDGAEPLGVGLAVLRAVHLLAEAELLVFGGDLEDAGAGHVHLVERLHGREPGRAALVGLAGGGRLAGAMLLLVARALARSLPDRQGHAPRRSRSAIMVSAARAAN